MLNTLSSNCSETLRASRPASCRSASCSWRCFSMPRRASRARKTRNRRPGFPSGHTVRAGWYPAGRAAAGLRWRGLCLGKGRAQGQGQQPSGLPRRPEMRTGHVGPESLSVNFEPMVVFPSRITSRLAGGNSPVRKALEAVRYPMSEFPPAPTTSSARRRAIVPCAIIVIASIIVEQFVRRRRGGADHRG